VPVQAPSISLRKAIAWTVATALVPLALYLVVSTIYITLWYAITRHQGPPPKSLILHAMWASIPFSSFASVGLWWTLHHRRGRFSELFNLRRPNFTDILLGLAAGALWVIIYGAAFRIVRFDEMFTLDSSKLLAIPGSASAAICEELLFRGFVLWIIARAGKDWRWQIGASALAFGFGHMLWGPGAMFWTAVLGASLATLTIWRGNIWPALFAPLVLDLCIEPALIRNALGL
jgi:hypothetical protein